MPPRVYTKPLWIKHGFYGFEEVFVPIGYTWVITDITAYADATSGDKLFLQDLVTNTAFFFAKGGIAFPEPTYVHWVGRHAIAPQGIEFVQGFSANIAAGGSSWDIYITGYEFLLV